MRIGARRNSLSYSDTSYRHAYALYHYCQKSLDMLSVSSSCCCSSLTFFIPTLVAKIISGRIGIVQYNERRFLIVLYCRQGAVESIPCFFSSWIAQNVGIILRPVASKIQLIHGIDTRLFNLFKYNRFGRKDSNLFPKTQCWCNLLLSKTSQVRVSEVGPPKSKN
jgi:hypothetical protein